MPRPRKASRWILPGALVAAAAVHPAVGIIYELQQPPPTPRLTVVIEAEDDGAGKGVVVSSDGALACGSGASGGCSVELPVGSRVTLTATRGEGSTFVGWGEACGPQAYRLFAWAAGVAAPDSARRPELAAALSGLAARPAALEPLQCAVLLEHPTTVVATFGEIPDEVEVAWIPDTAAEQLPDPAAESKALDQLAPRRPAPPPEAPPPEAPIELAMVPPPPLDLVVPVPPPPAPTPPPEEKQQPEIEASRLKSVEVDADNEVDKAPDDAAFLSDKNRDVAEQTVAKDTNLERAQTGERPASSKSDETSAEVGGAEDEIAQLETSEATAIDAERREETARSGDDAVARGVEVGDEGQDGDEGEDGDGKPSDKPGALAMRGIAGRGALGGPVVVGEGGGGGPANPGEGGDRGRRGARGRRGIKTELAFEDYERIVGDDTAAEEIALARRTESARKGRWKKKQAAVKSALENFTPEVRTGNQTALKTRAAPFAVYIARMHRRIHELWGFGYLEDLDGKPASNPMNDWTLWTKIEIVINPDGTIDKTNIARPSGQLTFDVAALDTVLTSGPYEPPPKEIRSKDGKTYVHWSFHRDWRQCGTFGAEPFILNTPPRGGDRGMDDGAILAGVPRRARATRGEGGGEGGGDGRGGDEGAPAASARANAGVAAPDDPEAAFAANLWLTGFTKGDVAKMLKVSGAPFASNGGAVASTTAEVSRLYAGVLAESRSGVIRDYKIVSAAGYRRSFGALPDGVEAGTGDLLLVVRLPKEQFTVLLRESVGGEYRAVGFFR